MRKDGSPERDSNLRPAHYECDGPAASTSAAVEESGEGDAGGCQMSPPCGFRSLLAEWAAWSESQRQVNGEVADADQCIADLEALL
jgi:hypothetical protein